MVTGSFTRDFKEQNPDLVGTIQEFAQVYRDFKSDTESASKTLWSAYLVAVPTDKRNPYKNANTDELRRKLITSEFNSDYKVESYFLEKIFKAVVLSKAHTLYNIHLRKYEEFTAQVADMDLTDEGQFDRYVSTMTKFEKVIKVFDMLEKKYEESSKAKSKIEGGGQLSVAEKRRQKR